MSRFLVAAPHKSTGKTTVTLGLCHALSRQGVAVQPFKKGPDYIDPMWLSRASGRRCYNLDFHTQSRDELQATFRRHAAGADVALVEGNMGLFDSIDPDGRESNAALARLLDIPVVLVVSAQGMNRSIAPLVLGFQHFDPQLRIAGVVLNKVAGRRHEQKLRSALEQHTDLPLLGVIQRDPTLAIDERHLGLVPSNEAGAADAKLERLADAIAAQVDLARLREVTAVATELYAPPPPPLATAEPVRIAIARDAAFGFYYPDDLERLEAAGAQLVPFDTLHDTALPVVDGLFIGGGFPETQMEALQSNAPLRQALREAIATGLPAYAECGGLMYLARSIRWGERRCEMVGAIPADVVMHERPAGRGYVTLRPAPDHPWQRPDAPLPAQFNAHEFHYSSLENVDPQARFAYTMARGSGIDGQHDGLIYHNLLANYAHLRDVEAWHWAESFVDFVRRSRATLSSNATAI